MKNLIGISLVFLTLIACNKNQQVRGRILDGNTSKGIAGIPMYLLRVTDSEKDLGKAMYTESNEQGYFSFRQPRQQKKFKQVLRCDALVDKSYYVMFEDSIYLTEENQGETFNLSLFKKQKIHLNLVSDQDYQDDEIRLVLDFSTSKTGVYERYEILKGTYKDLEHYYLAEIFALEGNNTVSGYYTINGGNEVPVQLSFNMPTDPFYPQTLDVEIH